ncbi:hypothetical protein NC652_015442 [Populus alba x Populus x berolinensis]|nr:hypothetical protein NC652_015442 [Populus alba x Populus x berolinensis]
MNNVSDRKPISIGLVSVSSRDEDQEPPATQQFISDQSFRATLYAYGKSSNLIQYYVKNTPASLNLRSRAKGIASVSSKGRNEMIPVALKS